tara:strand:+ start:335 stop:1417 length:1083 start_codon:yes stop_codon:yes gene_type:complete
MEENKESVGGFEVFDTPEQLSASMQSEPQNETTQEAPQQESQPIQETSTPEVAPQVESQQSGQQQESAMPDDNYSDEQVEGAVLEFLSEKLGREITSFDGFSEGEGTTQIDERVEAIARFVNDTGRNPNDWFAYQQLNPSEMDDVTAVKVQIATENPELTAQEVELLLNSKYNINDDLASEDEINVAKLQLKMEANKARKNIEGLRSKYLAPQPQAAEPRSFVNDDWIADMSNEVDNLEGLEFDLSGDKKFTFGFDEAYKNQLKQSNASIETFFDEFVNEDGSWDFDALSSTMAVRDNIDKIVSSAYTQGLSDGQRGIVDKAANISNKSPQMGDQNQSSPLADQVKQIMRGTRDKVTFNI